MPPWQPVYKRTRSRQLQALAFDVAQRFTDPSLVPRAVERARAASSEPYSIYWNPYAVAQGDAGVALMYGYFDACFPGEGWDRAAHHWIESAATGAAGAGHLPNGLFEGLSGLAFAVAMLSRGGQRYRNLLANLHEHVVEQARIDCEAARAALPSDALPFMAWDVIAGLTGTGAYLLARGDRAALVPILECLIELSGETGGVPNWRTPAEASGPWLRQAFPDGHLNCGLAHGIPGPLALLSLARIEGVSPPGSDDAIDRIAAWLTSHSADDPWGPNWPSAVPLVWNEECSDCGRQNATHAGWCYGSPGVARALWLAGCARNNAQYRATALEAMHAVIRRPPGVRALASPALCHGFAGLLAITLRFRHDCADAAFTTFAREMARQLETMHEPDSLLGYRTTEPGGGRIDQAGLLDGAPGIAMALLAAATDCPPVWDRLFLLS